MSNPILNRSPYFGDQGAYYGAPQQTVNPQELAGMYAAPPAGPVQTDRMTYDDVLIKGASVFGLMLVGAALGWVMMFRAPAVVITCWGIALVLVIINAVKRQPSPALISAFAVVDGVFVGGISAMFNTQWDGVVMQAVIATLAVFGVTLALFASGKIRASAKATKVFLIALIGYFVFALINFVLMVTGIQPAMFGMRATYTVMGIPLGVIIGIFVVFLAAYSFVLDFDAAQRGVRNGIPRRFAWTVAFSILVDVVWLYLEMLRFFAILARNN
ncbi:MAG: Bax inhibitor-1/YccA family protein [Bifidobacteriaceae bacterium]|jgi:uncharacterized YccA/Bax inhibitor family protein|nr:Bax inhibitor-1/YccA family protein [Bifidobacteriaceae bacterium]